MVVEFSVKNFRSVNELQTISFVATDLTSPDPELDKRNIVEVGSQRLLKTIGIYGANASGKSNILKALYEFSLTVISPTSPSQLRHLCQGFYYQQDVEETESFFQIVLLINKQKYRYGFTAKKGMIIDEWLFGFNGDNQTNYFLRKGSKTNIKINEETFDEGKSIPNIEHGHALFLSQVASYKNGIASKIRAAIVNIFGDANKGHKNLRFATLRALETIKYKKDILNLFSAFQLNYSDIKPGIKSEEILTGKPGEILLQKYNIVAGVTKHLQLDKDESTGTQKLFDIIGLIAIAFEEGGLLYLDELEGNFHPRLVIKIIELYNDPKVNNANAQLLFTSHDTNLMDSKLMRRDQFYFTEKTESDSTYLYSLSDLKGIPNDADFARQYLAGFYGATPILSEYMIEEERDSPPQMT